MEHHAHAGGPGGVEDGMSVVLHCRDIVLSAEVVGVAEVDVPGSAEGSEAEAEARDKQAGLTQGPSLHPQYLQRRHGSWHNGGVPGVDLSFHGRRCAMNEGEWLAATDPTPMLEHVRGKVSDRKRHLLACACWRRVLTKWPFPPMLELVEPYEKFADGHVTEAVLASALGDSAAGVPFLDLNRAIIIAQRLANLHRTWSREVFPVWNPLAFVSLFFSRVVAPFTSDQAETEAQAELMRHIFGNPFRTFPPIDFSANIVGLAEALYVGEDYAFALHDALLDAGHVELAEHFRDAVHPKGCWALDLIRGKQ
jgi:hypothetical protein